MIIYASSIWLDNATPLIDVFSTITLWFHKKTKERIFPYDFLDKPRRKFGDDSVLEILKNDNRYPILYSLVYTQRDREVPGRRWITEIGIRKESPDSEIQCSFLVQTSEIGVAVPAPQQTTRPRLINELLERCVPSAGMIGLSISTIDNMEDAELLSEEIQSPDRKYPIILVSPDNTQKYLIDFDDLLFKTRGLAKIIRIGFEVNTNALISILGRNHAAYYGAINILFPKILRRETVYVPTKLLLIDSLADLNIKEKDIESEILTLICYRTNLPNSRLHISPEIVKESIRQDEITRLSEKLSKEVGESKEWLTLFQEDNHKKQDEIDRLKNEIDIANDEKEYFSSEFDKADQERKELQTKVNGLLSQLEALKNKGLQSGSVEDAEELRDLIDKFIFDCITPYESLVLISKLFPDRIVILDNAYDSAKKSDNFRKKKELFLLLWKLAGAYWQTLIDGKSDEEARKVFGNSFSSKESETVEKKKEAIKRRTFQYGGKDITMFKHLKIGTKDSVAETLRIHFEWINDEKRIVIGHCGPHLENK